MGMHKGVKATDYSLKDRFESYVDWEPDSIGCLIWVGDIKKRYGSIKVRGKDCRAHRVSYELYRGRIPDGMHVLHTCDKPTCVNPNHLWLGTHTDNMWDMVAKGRDGHGNGRAKLTEDQVREIKGLLRADVSGAAIARMYTIDPSQISRIKLGKRWSHVY